MEFVEAMAKASNESHAQEVRKTIFPEAVVVSIFSQRDTRSAPRLSNVSAMVMVSLVDWPLISTETQGLIALKVEAIHGERFETRDAMRRQVFEYIEMDYNRQRRHSAIGMISPEAFEARMIG